MTILANVIPVVIVPVLRFYDKLQSMLDTVDYPIKHLIIVDNGGSLKSVHCEYIENISIINMPHNLGVPTSWNLGIQLEPFAEYWVFSQDDITWVPGGLRKISDLSAPDCMAIDMIGQRPFSTFSVGEDVIDKVGIFDESFFPLLGDDFNFHKRCHRENIREVDISGTFIAEKSSTIKSMLQNGETTDRVLLDNYARSVYGPAKNNGWSLIRRRKQGLGIADTPPGWVFGEIDLDSDYVVHNEIENQAFMKDIYFI